MRAAGSVAPSSPIQLTLTVALDGETVDIGVSSDQKVRDVLHMALQAFQANEDPDRCHLADGDRLIFPHETVGDVGVDGDGAVLALRLPF